MILFGKNKVNAIGLNISDSSIKLMQLEKAGNGLKPTAFANVPLMDKIINNNVIVNEQRLADNIRAAIIQAKHANSSYVVCSIPETKSFVRTLKIPKIPEVEIDGAIPFELEQDIPIPVDQVYLDWQLIREFDDKLELLITAAPKDYVDSLVQSIRLAKLIPVAMELESQAIARSLISAEEQKKSVLVVNLTGRQTSFIIVDAGIIAYSSAVPIAGTAFTESISRNLGVSPAQAEKLKRTMGLTTETHEGDVRKAILPILDNIIDEIKNVVRFYEEHSQEHKKIETILLSGGSTKLLGITDYISARINLGSTKSAVDVALGDPWVNTGNLTLNQSQILNSGEALEYSTAIGLALRGVKYEAR